MRWPFALVPLLVLTFAGCVTPEIADEPERLGYASTFLHGIVHVDGSPARLALVEARDADGSTLWFASTHYDGMLRNVLLTGAEQDVYLYTGNGTYRLDDARTATPVDGITSPLSFTERYAFPDPSFPLQLGTTCTEKLDGDIGCGLDEPSVEVDARGWIYYTAACCFLVSSPVFVSKDGGATFENLANPFKDAYGNEGDLAIDDEGNLYYMDIDLATMGIARWNSDLEPEHGYRRPGEPLVDRPWIRAGSGGVVHAIYNTGTDTVYYRSTDHALTFTAAPSARFGSALARAYSDVRHDIVGFVGAGAYMESTDAGATWGERTEVPGCGANTASVDAARTVWFQGDGCVIGRKADGTWTTGSYVADGYETYFDWMGAGADGAVTVAFYGRPTDVDAETLGLEPDAWYLFTAFSTDADSEAPHWAVLLADPEPLGYGDLGRRLGDFFQTVIGPDGAIHIAYSRNPEMDDSATSVYIGTAPVPGLAPSAPLVGPFA